MKTELLTFLRRASVDRRLQPTHLNVMTAALCLKSEEAEIQVSRRRLMQLASVRSISTYHKCIADLVKYGYINYKPSYHPKQGSLIQIL